jgi:hypothetical protein
LETNETEDSMIKECKLKDFGQFITVLGDAINKREINSKDLQTNLIFRNGLENHEKISFGDKAKTSRS